MADVVTALTNSTSGLTAGAILSPLASMVPFYVVIVPVALFIRFFRRGVNGIGRGKAKA